MTPSLHHADPAYVPKLSDSKEQMETEFKVFEDEMDFFFGCVDEGDAETARQELTSAREHFDKFFLMANLIVDDFV